VKLLAPLAFAVVLVVTTAARAQPPRFLVTPIDHAPPRIGDWDDDYIGPVGMNDLGQVLGSGVSQGDRLPMWIWSAQQGVRTYDLGEHWPTGINNAGQVVLGNPASIWSAGNGLQPLAPGGTPRAINNAGVVVGFRGIQNVHAAFWPTPDDLELIPRLPGRTGESVAADINDRGDIVGYSDLRLFPDPNSRPHGFLRTAEGVLIDLGTLPGHTASRAGRVNERTHVTGSSFNTVEDVRGFLWTPERGMQDLEDVTGIAMTAWDINDFDVIIGRSLKTDRFVYWSPEDGLHELEALLDPSASGWRIGSVIDLNNAGQVLASSLDRGPLGEVTYLLLTPVPEPAAAAAILATLALLAARRRGGLGENRSYCPRRRTSIGPQATTSTAAPGSGTRT
jgi:probable HAF family extracellular repeat protein